MKNTEASPAPPYPLSWSRAMDAEAIAKGLSEAQRADLRRIDDVGIATSAWQLGIDLFALAELHRMKLIHRMPMRNGDPLWGMAKGGAEVCSILKGE